MTAYDRAAIREAVGDSEMNLDCVASRLLVIIEYIMLLDIHSQDTQLWRGPEAASVPQIVLHSSMPDTSAPSTGTRTQPIFFPVTAAIASASILRL
jgi:hypothetical protein